MNKHFLGLVILALVLAISFMTLNVIAAVPNGANWTYFNTSTAQADTTTAREAYAGNVTELTMTTYATTQAWQGYFGNVSGTIQLADSSDNILYNWSAASPTGEIVAVNKTGVNWGGLVCYNFSDYNATDALEVGLGINGSDTDGINETFTATTHTAFSLAGASFTAGQCNSTSLYNNLSAGTFEEVLLWEGKSLVFTSLLKNNVIGFDARTHDFEMLVIEDGHGAEAANSDSYYFYIELQ